MFFVTQKTAYEMRISDWSSDVCSSDLDPQDREPTVCPLRRRKRFPGLCQRVGRAGGNQHQLKQRRHAAEQTGCGERDGEHDRRRGGTQDQCRRDCREERSEEHTSELQSLMRISYAVFCLKKKNKTKK